MATVDEYIRTTQRERDSSSDAVEDGFHDHRPWSVATGRVSAWLRFSEREVEIIGVKEESRKSRLPYRDVR